MARTMENYTIKWAFHDVAPEDLEPGDHIYKWSSPRHAYHGIVLHTAPSSQTDVNDAPRDVRDRIMVLRFPCVCCRCSISEMKAQRETLHAFEARSRNVVLFGGLKVARYGVPVFETWLKRHGTCYAVQCDSTVEVLQRAESLLNGAEDLVLPQSSGDRQKCEHFAFWCKTGMWQSRNIDGVRRAAACSMSAAVATGMRLHNPTVGLVSLLGGAVLRQAATQPLQMPTHVESGNSQEEPEESHDVEDSQKLPEVEESLPDVTTDIVAANAEAPRAEVVSNTLVKINEAASATAHFTISTPRQDFMIATPRMPGSQERSSVPPSDRLGIWFEDRTVAAENARVQDPTCPNLSSTPSTPPTEFDQIVAESESQQQGMVGIPSVQAMSQAGASALTSGATVTETTHIHIHSMKRIHHHTHEVFAAKASPTYEKQSHSVEQPNAKMMASSTSATGNPKIALAPSPAASATESEPPRHVVADTDSDFEEYVILDDPVRM